MRDRQHDEEKDRCDVDDQGETSPMELVSAGSLEDGRKEEPAGEEASFGMRSTTRPANASSASSDIAIACWLRATSSPA